jgi:hypothetical protein
MNNCWYRPNQSVLETCKYGHLLTPDNLYHYNNKHNVLPGCLTCKREAAKAYYERTTIVKRGGVKNPRSKTLDPPVTAYRMTEAEMKRASCQGEDETLFYYPSRADKDITTEDIAGAVAICDTCPVKAQCLREGVENQDWSVRGGKLLKNGKIMRPGKPKAERRTEHKAAGPETAITPLERYLGKHAGTTCKNSHPITRDTVVEYSGRPGWFHCMVCQQEKVGLRFSLDGLWKKCLSGEHYMVPENTVVTDTMTHKQTRCRLCRNRSQQQRRKQKKTAPEGTVTQAITCL